MLGKKKCKILREIRRQIASENDIPFVTEECRYKGDCKGTCPKCESELRYLEAQLEKRRSLGKAVTVSALALSLAAGLGGCGRTLEGDVAMTEGYAANTEECVTTEGEVAETYVLEGDVAYVPEDTKPEDGSVDTPTDGASETADAADEQN